MDNENASAGGIITLVSVFVLSGILLLLIGFAIDKVIMANIAMFGTGAGFSQMRFDIVTLELMVFRAEPVIMLLGLGINYWINSLRQFSGAISLGVLLQGAIEMIFSTLIVIALTLFGGMGLDMLIKVVNGWNVGTSALELYSAVQYTGPVFYGVMFLVCVSVVILFFILCVQTVDYTNQYG